MYNLNQDHMEVPNQNFITNTASDYDMTIEDVQHIWDNCSHPNEFYEELELFILLRANHIN